MTRLIDWRPYRAARRCAWALAMTLSVTLAACGGGSGGGGGDSGPGAPQPPAGQPGQTPAPAAAQLVATAGGAADSAQVQWVQAGGNGPWTLERWHEGDTAPVTLTAEASSAGGWVDTALVANTTYSYRLRDRAGTVVLQASTTTGDAPALRSELGQTLSEPQTLALTDQASESTAGAVSLKVQAGTFSANASATVQAHAHTLADGVGEAWSIELDQAPQRPLTVALSYGESENADEVDNQLLAARTSDGRWWLLPATTHERAARRLAVTLPPTLLAAQAGMAARNESAAALAQPAAATGTHTRVVLVRFVSLKLQPRQASVRVLGSLYLTPVSTWDVNLWECTNDSAPLCIPSVALVQRDFPVRNTQAGFERRWLLEGSATPGSELGTITPAAPTGVLYRAPATVPAINPVTLRFESLDTRRQRRAVVSARLRISEDRWEGPMTLSNTVDGVGYYYAADTRWVLDPSVSTESIRVYRAQGRVTLHIPMPACSLTPSPDHVEIGVAAGFAELEVDETTDRYHLRLNALWPTTLVTCLGTGMPTQVGVLYDQAGAVADGRLQGSEQSGTVYRVWNLHRPE